MCNMWEVLSMSEWKMAANAVAVNRWQDLFTYFYNGCYCCNQPLEYKKPILWLIFLKKLNSYKHTSEVSLLFSLKSISFYSIWNIYPSSNITIRATGRVPICFQVNAENFLKLFQQWGLFGCFKIRMKCKAWLPLAASGGDGILCYVLCSNL